MDIFGRAVAWARIPICQTPVLAATSIARKYLRARPFLVLNTRLWQRVAVVTRRSVTGKVDHRGLTRNVVVALCGLLPTRERLMKHQPLDPSSGARAWPIVSWPS